MCRRHRSSRYAPTWLDFCDRKKSYYVALDVIDHEKGFILARHYFHLVEDRMDSAHRSRLLKKMNPMSGVIKIPPYQFLSESVNVERKCSTSTSLMILTGWSGSQQLSFCTPHSPSSAPLSQRGVCLVPMNTAVLVHRHLEKCAELRNS